MQNDENMKSYTAAQLQAMTERGEDRTDWRKVDAMGQEELERLIAEDPEERLLDPVWEEAELMLPERKQLIHLRVDPDVLRFFKSQGKGYQTRMNAVLRHYMAAQEKRL